jgi:hypothetical protein
MEITMSYKTILVHCNDKRRIERLLAPAVSLADRFQSHLIGLSVVPPVAIVSAGHELQHLAHWRSIVTESRAVPLAASGTWKSR